MQNKQAIHSNRMTKIMRIKS